MAPTARYRVLASLGVRELPWLFLGILAAMNGTYLALAEVGKSYFYRHPAR